eukprot:7073653-Alexandrium_andersonii.AAC.1
MSASLVGSEMCIRDRQRRAPARKRSIRQMRLWGMGYDGEGGDTRALSENCLLYTSDAADDM